VRSELRDSCQNESFIIAFLISNGHAIPFGLVALILHQHYAELHEDKLNISTAKARSASNLCSSACYNGQRHINILKFSRLKNVTIRNRVHDPFPNPNNGAESVESRPYQ
jgi:hypothetical protein